MTGSLKCQFPWSSAMRRDLRHTHLVTYISTRNLKAFSYPDHKQLVAWQLWRPSTYLGASSGHTAWTTCGSINQADGFHACWCHSQDKVTCWNTAGLPTLLMLKGNMRDLPHLLFTHPCSVSQQCNITSPAPAQVLSDLSLKWFDSLTQYNRKLVFCVLGVGARTS